MVSEYVGVLNRRVVSVSALGGKKSTMVVDGRLDRLQALILRRVSH